MAMAKILLCVVFAVGLASAAVEVNMMSDDVGGVEVTTTQKAGDNCQGAKAGDKCAHPAPLAATAAPS